MLTGARAVKGVCLKYFGYDSHFLHIFILNVLFASFFLQLGMINLQKYMNQAWHSPVKNGAVGVGMLQKKTTGVLYKDPYFCRCCPDLTMHF